MFYVVCTKVFIIGFYFTCRYDLYMLLLIQLFYSCSKQGLGALTTVSIECQNYHEINYDLEYYARRMDNFTIKS